MMILLMTGFKLHCTGDYCRGLLCERGAEEISGRGRKDGRMEGWKDGRMLKLQLGRYLAIGTHGQLGGYLVLGTCRVLFFISRLKISLLSNSKKSTDCCKLLEYLSLISCVYLAVALIRLLE